MQYELLVYSGAPTNFNADKRYQRQALASLNFEAQVTHDLPAAHESVPEQESMYSFESDRTSLVADSQHAKRRASAIQALDTPAPRVTQTSPELSLWETAAISAQHFEVHERLWRDSQNYSLTGKSACTGDKTHNMLQDMSEYIPTPVLDRPGSLPGSVVPQTPVDIRPLTAPDSLRDIVATKARHAMLQRRYNYDGLVRITPDQGTTRVPCTITPIKRIHGELDDTIDITPVHAQAPAVPLSVSSELVPPTCVNRYITKASSEQGKSRTPPSEPHTLSQSNRHSKISNDLSPNGAGSDKENDSVERRAFIVAQQNSPYYDPTFKPSDPSRPEKSILQITRAHQYTENSLGSILGTAMILPNEQPIPELLPQSSAPEAIKPSPSIDYSTVLDEVYGKDCELLVGCVPAIGDSTIPLVPAYLADLEREHHKPARQVRPLRPLERGYWLIDLRRLGFGLPDFRKFWRSLTTILRRKRLYWVTAQYFESTVRVYCFGECIIPVWMMLYTLSEKKMKRRTPWIDASGTQVLSYPP